MKEFPDSGFFYAVWCLENGVMRRVPRVGTSYAKATEVKSAAKAMP